MNVKKYDIMAMKNCKIFVISLIISETLFLSGCWFFSSTTSTIKSKLVVINVLDAAHFKDCHMTGSINIPFDELEDTIKTLDKNNRYVVYCSNYACTAAPFAAKIMKDAGFNQVFFLPGGIAEWYQKELPCIGQAQLDYLKDVNIPFDEDEDQKKLMISLDSLKTAMIEAKMFSI